MLRRMIVDNSIVVIDGYLEYLGKGFKPYDAAIESARQYFMPMLLATICICAIFYPFLITMKGMFHDCLEDFPVTITINLMVSLVLAVTVIPFLETRIIKPDKVSTDGNKITKWVQRTYDKVLDWTFAHPWMTIGGGIAIAMIIVFFFLLFNFKKYGVTTVCMVALALMIPGALIGLGLMNRALGLTSIFGLITLMGMIMRNEILIFEHAISLIENEKLKMDNSQLSINNYQLYNEVVKQAAYEAGKRRMVPIFLTTATTAVGVVPMIIAQSSFWMPVGVTIFAGGIGSLIMVVTMLPVIYWKVSTKKN